MIRRPPVKGKSKKAKGKSEDAGQRRSHQSPTMRDRVPAVSRFSSCFFLLPFAFLLLPSSRE
jgi:hypothetical protein